ncbi:MAG: dephospho-CoA kinase [Anaerolineae bacterium]|nr:dephospho-CoA kinase [Anaerolineae bacterium]
MAAKIVIGLTGNIGTGKSLILRMLQELGSTVIDADKLVHQLMKKGSPVYDAIVNEFGAGVLDQTGEINRRNLSKIVFTTPGALAKLEGMTHPAVHQEVVRRIDQATTQVVAVEAIKLFESNLIDLCHSKWVVTAPPDVQLKRLVERRKMSLEQAQQRLKAQSPQAEKTAKADVVIDNSGDLAKTWALVKKQYTTLLQDMPAEEAPSPEPEPAPTPETAVAAADVDVSAAEVTIRRAKRNDMELMAQIIAAATNGALDPDLSQMMEAIFSRAYIVAQSGGHVVGIAGWQTENLIAGLQDFYVIRADLWPTVGQRMLEMIHKEIEALSCEVAIVFVMKQAGSQPIEFFESQGYQQAEIRELGYMWEDAAREWQPENSILLYKKLREQRIMVPM